MKAPDKAYIAAQWHADEDKSVLYASYEKTSHPDEEVFIRKDALEVWAIAHREALETIIKTVPSQATAGIAGQIDAYKKFIEKLNSM